MEREWDSQMIRFLLTAMNREKYGERKVVEVSFRDWDGDVSKLSESCIRGIIEILRRQEASEETGTSQAERCLPPHPRRLLTLLRKRLSTVTILRAIPINRRPRPFRQPTRDAQPQTLSPFWKKSKLPFARRNP
jgi:hypothetical protein